MGLLHGAYLALTGLRGDRRTAGASLGLTPAVLPGQTPPRLDWHPQRWAVLGASGFIGSALVAFLSDQGVCVTPLVAPRLVLQPQATDGREVAAIARTHPAIGALAEVMTGIDVVVNAAGMATPDGNPSPQLYGANALLPAILAVAGAEAGVSRVIHLSSAAVQGDRAVLDASAEVEPFSPYSRSKALGEAAVLALAGQEAGQEARRADLVVIRATSVQGPGRPTTEALRRIARSPLASVAAPGDQPTVVSSVTGLVNFVWRVGACCEELPPIIMQPWEGLNVQQVLMLAGGRKPAVLPAWLCRCAISLGALVGKAVPRVGGNVRRLEVMWFGQAQERTSHAPLEHPNPKFLTAVLKRDGGPA